MHRLRLGAVIAVVVLLSSVTAPSYAQSPAPDWQTAAGGKLAFDVASVKQNKTGDMPKMNIPLGGGDSYTPTGGIFSTSSMRLTAYMAFAYKITGSQMTELLKQLPDWALNDRFDIEARSDNSNPTKDQLRLMMQSLLTDRFKLVVHTETQQVPVFAMVLVKPGKLGPHLQQHPANDTTCASAAPLSADYTKINPTIAGGFPASCGSMLLLPGAGPGQLSFGARNVPISLIASRFGEMPEIGRPIVDETGLTGMFDFTLEYSPDNNNATPNPETDTQGPTLLEALPEQLGLKLVPKKHAFDVFVVDHIEHPSAN